jgi:hypothetical protein
VEKMLQKRKSSVLLHSQFNGKVHRKGYGRREGDTGYPLNVAASQKKEKFIFKKACGNKKEYYFCRPVLRGNFENRSRVSGKVHRHNEAQQKRKGTADFVNFDEENTFITVRILKV